MRSGFRADIQGLRAVAVLVVIAFHAGLPLTGGFVGVDIFFVISGFVITAMLKREWDRTGSVSIGAFYLRRAARLTPALALVVAVTVVAASLLLSPFDQQVPAAETGLGAIALVANWVIASQSGDYFGPDAETNPLLHTWSLSVEEQFYLVFPLTLLVVWRLGRRARAPHVAALVAVCVIGLASLAMIRGAALGFPGDSWLIGYYSPLTRAWEFAAGAALALVAHWLPRSKVAATAAGTVGVALTAVSLTMIDATTPFPGKWTLVPVVGATLVLAAGSLQPDNPVSRVLAIRPAVKVGDWSYSLYLWHWPFIVLAHALFPLSAWAPLVAAVLCVAPAVASYTWVETPFRAVGRRSPGRAAASVGATVVCAAVLALACSLVATRVWQPAYESGRLAASRSASQPVSTDDSTDATSHTCGWDAVAGYINGNGWCLQSAEGPPEVVLLGDSHAEHLFVGLADALPSADVAVVSFRAPYMFGTPAGLDLALDEITSGDAPAMVIVSRQWTRGGLDPADQLQPLDHAVERLTSAGVDVVLVDDVPAFPFPSLACSHRLAPVIPTTLCDEPLSQADDGREAYLSDLHAVAERHPGTRVVEIGTTLCDRSSCSMLTADGEVAYVDSDHLSAAGSKAFGARLVELADLAPRR